MLYFFNLDGTLSGQKYLHTIYMSMLGSLITLCCFIFRSIAIFSLLLDLLDMPVQMVPFRHKQKENG